VTEEVRSTFTSDEEITLTSVGGLKYMLACLNEGLRSYPPVPFGLPRIVPRGGATISGMAVPENVSAPAPVTWCGSWNRGLTCTPIDWCGSVAVGRLPPKR
jgi:hypothetical protein